MTLPTPLCDNPTPHLVRGQWYRVLTFNSKFDFWVPRRLSREEARVVALEYVGPEFYGAQDIESVRARPKKPSE